MGGDGEPVRLSKARPRDPRGADDAPPTSAGGAPAAIRAHVAEHDLAAWVSAQLADARSAVLGVRFAHGDDASSRSSSPSIRRRSSRSARFAAPIRRVAGTRRGGACGAGAVACGRPVRARRRCSRAVARAVRAHADEIADSIVAETAKPRTEAIAGELYTAVDHALWLAKQAPRVLADERVRFNQLHLKTKKAWLVYEPLGVVAAITPWNIPFGIPFSSRRECGRRRQRRRPQAVRADAADGRVGAAPARRGGRSARARAARAGRGAGGRGARRRAGNREGASSPARSPSAAALPRPPARAAARWCSSSAARTRCSSSPMPISTARSRARSSRRS